MKRILILLFIILTLTLISCKEKPSLDRLSSNHKAYFRKLNSIVKNMPDSCFTNIFPLKLTEKLYKEESFKDDRRYSKIRSTQYLYCRVQDSSEIFGLYSYKSYELSNQYIAIREINGKFKAMFLYWENETHQPIPVSMRWYKSNVVGLANHTDTVSTNLNKRLIKKYFGFDRFDIVKEVETNIYYEEWTENSFEYFRDFLF
jgi:hypothetical protein